MLELLAAILEIFLEIFLEAAFEFAAEFVGALVGAGSPQYLIRRNSEIPCWRVLGTYSWVE
jgi:hypothetical protein